MDTERLSNPAAEWAIAASLVAHPSKIAEIVGSGLEGGDFVSDDARAVYSTTVESFYADLPIEPLVIAERLRPVLSKLWKVREQQVGTAMLERLSARDMSEGVTNHAAIVKRLSTSRQLLGVLDTAQAALISGAQTPEQVAAGLSTDTLGITSGNLARAELHDWMDLGRTYAKHLQRQRLAKEKGIELAVYTGLKFIDDYTRGIAPTELCVLGGAPGVGKSVVGWKAAEGFAYRQMSKAPEHRVATLVISMEMGEVPSATRLAQSITRLDGMKLREGDISDQQFNYILREWQKRDGLPLLFNFASNFRLSQLRALIVEAIRRHNCGFVVLDHFRQIDPDRPIRDANDRDETKIRFLKESLCKDLNIAMLVLAHTLKMGRASEGNPRPRLADLRGSGQIAANCDFVGLMHRPHKNATDAEKMALTLKESDAELWWEKARHTAEGPAYFTFEPETMTVRAR